MVNSNNRDIVLHYDEITEEVVFYSIDSKVLNEILSKESSGARTDVKWFRDQEPEDAEKALGSMVFSLIDNFSTRKIGIRDYKELSDSLHSKYVAELEEEAANNDSGALYDLFLDRHHHALKNKSQASLEEAERLLIRSADLGYEQAVATLENDWQLMRAAVTRSIKRAKNT